MKFLFKRILASNYSFSKRWANKKMPETVINGTVHTFLLQFSFIVAGLCSVLLGSIDFKFKYPEIIFMAIALFIGYGFMNITRKAIIKWNIEKEYKTLSKEQRFSRNTFAFIFFWSCFALFFYLVISFLGGYSLK